MDLVNALTPERVVEVGCGLGDILSRIEARDRFGLDEDANVIRAARFLHGGRYIGSRVSWRTSSACCRQAGSIA